MVQATPQAADLTWANWCLKAVKQSVAERFGKTLSPTGCLPYLQRLGFVAKLPGKRLLKADAKVRATFVADYRCVRTEAVQSSAKVGFVDDKHFRADVEVRQMWSLRGKPAWVDSTSPRPGKKASYYSAVCLETGEVESMAVQETCTAETSVAFQRQLREHHTGPLIVIWDNGPAHPGEAIRTYLATPDLKVRLVVLPAYSPDFNTDEAVWDWVREGATTNTYFGTKANVQQTVDRFFASLAHRTDEAKCRCRALLQSRTDDLGAAGRQPNVDFTPV